MSTQLDADVDLEELLGDGPIPCEGVFRDEGKPCGRPAQLISYGHGPTCQEPCLKCVDCWQKWYSRGSAILSSGRLILCLDCGRHFTSIKEFSDYRPL